MKTLSVWSFKYFDKNTIFDISHQLILKHYCILSEELNMPLTDPFSNVDITELSVTKGKLL